MMVTLEISVTLVFILQYDEEGEEADDEVRPN